jgi:transposase
VIKVEETDKVLMAELAARKGARPLCGTCKRRRSGYDRLPMRRWRYVPLWGMAFELRYQPRRVDCRRCGITAEHMPWSMGNSRLSLHMIVFCSILARLMSWQEVARLVHVHWNTVRAAVAKAVEYGLLHRTTDKVLYIGIDELARRRGHVYQTNVYDLANKRLIWTGEGRGADTLVAFFAEWGTERIAAIEAICCDMWEPYVGIIRIYAPQALLIYDKFHIVKHLHEAVDQVRKDEAREKAQSHPGILADSKYLWIKNPENLTDKQRLRLSDLERLNLKVNRAYILKESFKRFWEYIYPANAAKYLSEWCRLAMRSGLEPIKKFVGMVRRHWDNILTYFRLPLSNAVSEGLNRKARVLSHRAYGYRTASTFRLALYHYLGDLPLPQITHEFL